MTAAGDLGKSDGDVLYAADITAIMNAMGSLFNDTAQNIFDSAYNGFDSRLDGIGTPSYKNIDYDVFLTDSMTDSGNIEYDATKDIYWGPNDMEEAEYVTYDEFDDASVDTDLWTITAGVTEHDGYLDLSVSRYDTSGSSTATATSDEDVFSYGSDYWAIWVDIESGHQKQDTGGTSTIEVKIGTQAVYSLYYDGSSSIDRAITAEGVQAIWLGTFGFYRVQAIGGAWGSWTYSTTMGNGIVTFTANCGRRNSGTSSYANMQINYIRRNTFATAIAASTNYIISDTVTASSTITNSISTWNDTIMDGTAEFSVAYDGTNYDAATSAIILRNTDTGTSLKNKWILSGVGYLSEYATKYNLY